MLPALEFQVAFYNSGGALVVGRCWWAPKKRSTQRILKFAQLHSAPADYLGLPW